MAEKTLNSRIAMLSVSLRDMFMLAVRFWAYSFFYGYYYFAHGKEERKALV